MFTKNRRARPTQKKKKKKKKKKEERCLRRREAFLFSSGLNPVELLFF